MSIQCGVTCLDCNASAPGIGDGGYFGAPSLDVSPGAYTYEPEMLSFGFLYPPLKELALRTYELDAFESFLQQHRGHLVYLHSDHDDPEGYPPEIRAKASAFEYDERFKAELKRYELQQKEAMHSGRYVNAYYALDCRRCCATYVTTEQDRFRSFTELTLTKQAVRLFLERWGTLTPDDGWNHRMMGPLDPWSPFLEQLPEFVKLHESHPLVARLSAAPVSATQTSEELKNQLAQEQTIREERRRRIAWLWPPPQAGLRYGTYLSRVLVTWLVVAALPLAFFTAGRPSVTTVVRVAQLSAVLAAPSLLWTLMGARFAWQRLGKSYRVTIGNGVQNAIRGLAFSWAGWAAANSFGPTSLPLHWALLSRGMEWLHLWLLPSTIVIGAVAAHVQWRAITSPLGRGRGTR